MTRCTTLDIRGVSEHHKAESRYRVHYRYPCFTWDLVTYQYCLTFTRVSSGACAPHGQLRCCRTCRHFPQTLFSLLRRNLYYCLYITFECFFTTFTRPHQFTTRLRMLHHHTQHNTRLLKSPNKISTKQRTNKSISHNRRYFEYAHLMKIVGVGKRDAH